MSANNIIVISSSGSNSANAAKSPSYHPMTDSEWLAFQNQLPNQEEELEPSEHFSEHSINKPSSKRNHPDTAANEAGPSKKARSSPASCENCTSLKEEFLKLKEHVEKHCVTVAKHDLRLDIADKDFEDMEDALRETFTLQANETEKMVKVNFDNLIGRMKYQDSCNYNTFNNIHNRQELHHQNMDYFFQRMEAHYTEFKKFKHYVSNYLWEERKKNNK